MCDVKLKKYYGCPSRACTKINYKIILPQHIVVVNNLLYWYTIYGRNIMVDKRTNYCYNVLKGLNLCNRVFLYQQMRTCKIRCLSLISWLYIVNRAGLVTLVHRKVRNFLTFSFAYNILYYIKVFCLDEVLFTKKLLNSIIYYDIIRM